MLRSARDSDHIGQLRFALCNRARLVKQDGVYRLDTFEALTALDENALFSAFARSDHDSSRSSETQCTWAGDYQDGDRRHDGDQPGVAGSCQVGHLPRAQGDLA